MNFPLRLKLLLAVALPVMLVCTLIAWFLIEQFVGKVQRESQHKYS
ncbi:MAG: hypothetical protein KZQ58_06615 [gamma proteobacterium symbiont of Bathyaustriella thionipta]|nr:hypothetical protein [gamma proteobacterium symbiont of Bathyaustriella thionipta]